MLSLATRAGISSLTWRLRELALGLVSLLRTSNFTAVILCNVPDNTQRVRADAYNYISEPGGKMMNAIELLTKDHRVVDELFEQVESSDTTASAELFLEIKAELEAHAHIEESICYPALQADGDEELIELTSEALQEHAQMKVFLGELDVVQSDSDKFEPLLTKLIEDVRHHVEEE